MKYRLTLTQTVAYGQIPVTGEDGKVQFIIKGNLDNPSHTLYLCDINHKEIGRLYTDKISWISSYTIDVVNHSLVHVKRLGSSVTNLFFVSRLGYWVTGSVKNGSYRFRSGLKNVATVDTEVAREGIQLVCSIKRPEDVPFILLISILFTQWHVNPLRLPSLRPFKSKLSTDLD